MCEKSVGTPTTHSSTARHGPGLAHGLCLDAGRGTGAALPRGLSSQRPPGNPGQSLRLCSACDKTHPFPVALLCSSASAAPEFEGRGGDDLGTEIANTLYRIFNNKSSIDLKSLCISPREHCWVLYVDVLVGLTPLRRPRPTSVGNRGPAFLPELFPSSVGYSVSRVRLLGETLVSHNGF